MRDRQKTPKECSINKADLGDAHERRWAYGHVPFFAAAYMLDPEFRDHKQMSNEEVVESWLDTLEKLSNLTEVQTLQKQEGR